MSNWGEEGRSTNQKPPADSTTDESGEDCRSRSNQIVEPMRPWIVECYATPDAVPHSSEAVGYIVGKESLGTCAGSGTQRPMTLKLYQKHKSIQIPSMPCL